MVSLNDNHLKVTLDYPDTPYVYGKIKNYGYIKATIFATVTKSGKKLPPLIIVKKKYQNDED